MIFLLRWRRWVLIFLGLSLFSGLLDSRAQQATPIMTESAKLFDFTILRVGHFGRSVACTSETLAVGAIYDDTGSDYSDGAVSVFERSGPGWQLRQKLTLLNGWPNDNVGSAVALAGDTLVVGARGGNFPPNDPRTGRDSSEGLVLVYTRDATGRWRQTQLFSANDVQDGDYFGTSVALHGDVLVVGNNSVRPERRAAYVFHRTNESWQQVQKLESNGPLALFGDTLAVQVLTGLEQSAVQVYARSGANWTRRQVLTGDPSTTAFSTSFGSTLALSENYLAIGAPAESSGLAENEGRVYVFTRSGVGWVREQKLTLPDAAADDAFGASLAIRADTLAIGAAYGLASTKPGAGTVHLFKHSGNVWIEQQRLQASDGLKGEGFARTLALSDRVALVGAFAHGRTSPMYIPGAAYVYELAPSRPVVNVSAASYTAESLAPASIVTAFGTGLATQTQSATSPSLPETLAGTSVKVTDSAGMARLARLFFVSPTQLNYQIPPDTARGAATVTITSGDGALAQASLPIETVAPGLFTADASGRGLAAAVVLRVKADGTQQFEPVARFDAGQGRFVAVPLELSRANEQVFLILFGTGLRLHSGLHEVRATAGGATLDVGFAGAQGDLTGLDQVNLRLPASLVGRGEVEVGLMLNGKTANPVRIFIR